MLIIDDLYSISGFSGVTWLNGNAIKMQLQVHTGFVSEKITRSVENPESIISD
jgi:hypothetical protein